MALRRVQLLRYLPEDKHANSRWLFRTLLDLADERGVYTGSQGHLRDEAGYSSGPDAAPRTSVMLRQLERAGLIMMKERRESGKRALEVQVAKITEMLPAVR